MSSDYEEVSLYIEIGKTEYNVLGEAKSKLKKQER